MSAGLSLSAARADNFYHPPDWDPTKESLDQHHGSHPLRERARKLDQGILIIRFEMPFNVWCDGCADLIGKGVRFNAEKQAAGMYLSTRKWKFTMRHHCGCSIVVETDPKNCEYVVTQGARRKETTAGKDSGVVVLPSDEEKRRAATDPIFRLEHFKEAKEAAKRSRVELASLLQISAARDAPGKDVACNRAAKRSMRVARGEARAREARQKELGLGVELLPENKSEKAASLALYQHKARGVAAAAPRAKQAAIMNEDIFGKKASSKRRRTERLGASSNHKLPRLTAGP